MILNSNFSPLVDNVITFNCELREWFVRNQDWLSYFELTHAGCLHFEEYENASHDIRVLGRMANAAHQCIEINNSKISAEERANLAVRAMQEIYNQNIDKLSDNAKKLYALTQDSLEDSVENNKINNNIKTLKRNGTKNNRPGKGHRNH